MLNQLIRRALVPDGAESDHLMVLDSLLGCASFGNVACECRRSGILWPSSSPSVKMVVSDDKSRRHCCADAALSDATT